MPETPHSPRSVNTKGGHMAVCRTLSAKERLFAEKLADGLGATEAYKSVYSNSAANRTAQANGRQIARRQRVIEEVDRLRRNPPANNFRALKEFAVGKLLKMAESDPNATARHRAMATLLKYADSGLRRQPAPQQSPQRTLGAHNAKADKGKIIEELRLIYAQALGTPAQPEIRSTLDLVADDPLSEDNPLPKRTEGQFAGPEIAAAAVCEDELNPCDRQREPDEQDSSP
jgi:hypothetical protein